MHSTFTAHGYAVNKRGLTVGIRHELQATSHEEALTAVQHEMQNRGYTHIRITRLYMSLTEITGGGSMRNDITDITLDEAADSAFQAELICRLMLDSDGEMTIGELNAMLTLLKQLSASAATWLIGKQGERMYQDRQGGQHEHD